MSPPTSPIARPVPTGAPAGGFSRRRFLAGAGAGIGLVAAGTWSDPALAGPNRQAVEQLLAANRLAATGSASAADGPILILLTLYGGNDGLNTVVPRHGSTYTSARGNMALDQSTLLPLDRDYGLHPGMPGFHKLFAAGQLAIVQGVGYANPSLSHFQSMDIWQSASMTEYSTGWLGRWLDGADGNPLNGLVIGPLVPLALQGADRQASAVLPPPISLPGNARVRAAYAAMQSPGPDRDPLEADMGASGIQFLQIEHRLAPILDGHGRANNALSQAGGSPTNIEGSATNVAGGVDLTQGGGSVGADDILSDQLNLVAAMVHAGVPVQVYSVSLGGFDTHSAQLQTHATLLSQLDSGLSRFLHQVAGAPHGRPVVALVYSEFGRMVRGNGSLGTDHGQAGVAFVAGSRVKGGFYGTPPSLTALNENGLVANLDFRSLYASVLEQVVGIDAGPVLGAAYPTLSLVT